MPLADIIEKDQTLYTPSSQELADSPQEYADKFRFHVATYVTIKDIESKWEATVGNLLKGRSATGLIYADTGYGKTSTGASLWHFAESKGVVTVPPFRWNSFADLLTATHGWVRYRLEDTRPDLIPNLEEKYRKVIAIGEKVLAQRMSHEKHLSIAQAQEATEFFKSAGRLKEELSPRDLLDYLRFATQLVLDSGYRGILILPDEFQLFKDNLDITQNLSNLKDFIFELQGGEACPIGCVVFTYNETFASIKESEYNYLLARFAEPSGNLINLESLYGETDFAKYLWEKLSDLRHLSAAESTAIDNDVLEALGQFLRHTRSRSLFSGPRSVVQTFRQAARYYAENNSPYSLLDFCKDYLEGTITYSGQHTDTANLHTQIMELPNVDTLAKRDIVKLLCVHPMGVPMEVFQGYADGLPDADRLAFTDNLLPEYVTNLETGPALVCYRPDLSGIDKLNEILKRLKPFNPGSSGLHQGAVRAFQKHLLPEIFKFRTQGTPLGLTRIREHEDSLDSNSIYLLESTVTLPTLPNYPDRTLTVHIGTEGMSSPAHTQLSVQLILDAIGEVKNICHVTKHGLKFQFNIQRPIDSQRIPKEIMRLGDLFSPKSVTPLLLLSILDFFDKESTTSRVKGAEQEIQAESLTTDIKGELIRYFFSREVKESAVSSAADLATVPAGRGFIEDVLKNLIPKRFPHYHAVATAKGWENQLGKYRDALGKFPTLGIRRGKTPTKDGPKLFNMGQVAFDNLISGVARDLLKVEQDSNRRGEPNIYFVLHPFEELVLERLENSDDTLTVDGKLANSIQLPKVYEKAKQIGYLDEEVERLMEILKARGMVDIKRDGGIDYLYLVETSINFAELQAKLANLEEIVALANSKGFQYQCDNLSTAQGLVVTLGIQNDEVMKDTLRQELNSADTNLKNECAKWIGKGQNDLKQKIHELGTLRCEVPAILKQPTGHPLTEFSHILFQSIRPDVETAYTKINEHIQKMQTQVNDACNKEIRVYQADMTPKSAIETAERLRTAWTQTDEKINQIRQDAKNAEQLFSYFERWRVLAGQVEREIQLMTESKEYAAVQNLIERFNDVQRNIRQHLADSRLSLNEVLGNHEHFKKQIESINAEFHQLLTQKEDTFIAYQSKIEEQLQRLPDNSLQLVDFNPIDADGCYRRVRENAVTVLERVVDGVRKESEMRKRELLKPIEVFTVVPESLKNEAEQLYEDIEELVNEFQDIRHSFTPEAVNHEKLSEWVEQLLSKLETGRNISDRRKQLERKLDTLVPNPSEKAQMLQEALKDQIDFTELIVQLLSEDVFHSTKEILECLEELYQANLVNLIVHKK
ncbi:MAG: hypothetical protein OXL96_06775 [Candidatus Poribacteria bacterium]|nr:hypothetical protein [Candidatus Poribacteria bacterium]